MKLTPDQLDDLYALSVCTGRPTADTPALVKHGLATVGNARFGDYVRITSKGEATLQKLPARKRNELDHQWNLNMVKPALTEQAKDATRKVANRGGRAATSRCSGDTELRSESEAGGLVHSPPSCGKRPVAKSRKAAKQAVVTDSVIRHRRTSSPTPPLKAGSTTRLRSAANPPSPTPSSSARPAPKAKSQKPQVSKAPGKTPNAVRVVIGSRATYYPLGTKLPNGQATNVRTVNKLFRSYPVASPEVKSDVLL